MSVEISRGRGLLLAVCVVAVGLGVGTVGTSTPAAGQVTNGTGCTALTLSATNTTVIENSGCYTTTFVGDATVSPVVVINASDVVLDGQGVTLDGQDNETLVTTTDFQQSNVTVRSFDMRDWGTGIVFRNVGGGRVENVLAGGGTGAAVELSGTSNTVVRNVTVNASSQAGIVVFGGSGNVVQQSSVERSDGAGVLLESTGGPAVSNVTVTDSELGLDLRGSSGAQIQAINVSSNRLGLGVSAGETGVTESLAENVTAYDTEFGAFATQGGSTATPTNVFVRDLALTKNTSVTVDGSREVAIDGIEGTPPATPDNAVSLNRYLAVQGNTSDSYLDVRVPYDSATDLGAGPEYVRAGRYNGSWYPVRGTNRPLLETSSVRVNVTDGYFGTLGLFGVADTTLMQPTNATAGSNVSHELVTYYANMAGNGQQNTVSARFDPAVAGNITVTDVGVRGFVRDGNYSVGNVTVRDLDEDLAAETVTVPVSAEDAGEYLVQVGLNVSVEYPETATGTVPVTRRINDANRGVVGPGPWANVSVSEARSGGNDTSTQPTPTVSVESTEVDVGGTTTVRTNLTAAPTGVSSYLVNVSVGNGSVGRITDASIGPAFEQTVEGSETYATVIDETNTTVTLAAEDFTEQVGPGATNVTLGTITLEGQNGGSATLIPEIDNQQGVRNESGVRITPTLTSGSLTVTTGTTDGGSTDTGDSTTEPQVGTGGGGGGGGGGSSGGSSDDSTQVTVDTSTTTETDSTTETETDSGTEGDSDSETRDIEIDVRNPDPDRPVDVDLEPTDSDDDADLTGLSVDVASSEDFSIRAAASARQPANAPEFTPQETEATEPLSYVDIQASVPNSDIDEASVDFRVSKDRLAAMENTDADDIAVYRHGTDGYEEVPIQQTRETGEFVYYRGTADGFSEWTVGAKQPRFEVLRAAVDVESVTVGDSVNVIVRITNTGGADGDFLAELLLNEEVVDSREVFIAPNGTSQVTFDREFGEAGTYRVRVNDASAGQVEVEDTGGSGATDAATNGTQTTETSTSSGIGGPPIDPVVALLTLVVVAAAVGYRLRQA